MVVKKQNLSVEVNGGAQQLFALFLPLLLMTFTNCLFLLVEKVLLARLSVQSMEAAVSSAYACQLFQFPCVALTLMTQVFVGRWKGAQEWNSIGPGVWQFIWFSILSAFITTPIGYFYGQFYFGGTAIKEIALPYYYFLMGINFLHPLGASLSCFYLGQGKARLILIATIGSQVLKLSLAYLLIFGAGSFPALGIMGGVASTLIAQGSFCVALFIFFLSPNNARAFNTREWTFKPKLFWECIHPGLLRAGNRVLNVASWASIAQLMTKKGGDYILVLSIGGTIFLLLPFISDAILQAQTTIVSHIVGAKKYFILDKAYNTAIKLAWFFVALIAIPLVVFPAMTFTYIFPTINLDETTIRLVFFGIWLCFIFYTIVAPPISYVLAFKDTKFSFFMGGVGWVNGFLMMYLLIVGLNITADQFWIALSFMHGSNALFYYLRMRYLIRQVTSTPTQPLRT